MEKQKLLKKKRALLSKGPKTQLAIVCNELAELYSREGKFEQSVNEYKEEAQLYKDLNKPILFARANRMIGEIYTNIAEFDKALKHERIHLDIAVKENNDLERQRALASIGRTYLTKAISDVENTQNDTLNKALESFLKSLMIVESLKEISKQEQMDMKARLLLNIGVIYENQGDYLKGIDYMIKSIQICKSHDIYEQLHHGYCSLALLNSKKGNYENAINKLNLALDVANRLSDKIPPLCSTLLSKAEVLIKLADFNSAKQVLLKAYKLKSPNIDERNLIEKNLKIVAAMCMTENQLLSTNADYKKKKSLYEKMGDGACNLKNFSKAIDYYKKMLECALANGDSGKDLLPVYVSLAETYKDNKEYDQAVHYFQKDLEITRNNSEESCTTLLSIAEILDLANRPYDQIAKVLEKAKIQAKNTGKMRLEGKVLKHFLKLMKKFDKDTEAVDLEKELIMLDYVESDSDSDEEPNSTPDIGDEINISEISDISDDNYNSNEESPNRTRTTRRRSKKFTVKKNPKGETQLHSACIKGNVYLVNQLIDQGHPVNIRDNSGWLPIHEAANYGYIEVVRVLIQKGAHLNDKGGTHCAGITPLHDACSNGHLELIEFLLDNGASPISQTNSGDTPLDMLKIWQKNADLNPIEQTHYETIVSRLTTALEKAGRSINNTKTKERGELLYKSPNKGLLMSPLKFVKSNSPYKSPRVTPKVGNLRYNLDTCDDLDLPSCSGYNRDTGPPSFESKRKQITKNLNLSSCEYSNSSDSSDNETGAGLEYKQIMHGLRKRCPDQVNVSSVSKFQKSGLVNEDDVGDEWLENDMVPGKKRKRNSSTFQQFVDTSGLRRSNSFNSATVTPTKTSNDYQFNDTDQENCLNELNIEEIEDGSNDSLNSAPSLFNNKRRKSQTSLIDAGFKKSRSDGTLSTLAVTHVNRISQKSHKRQQKLSSFISINNLEADSTSHSGTSQIERSQYLNSTIRSVIAVNVRINGKLWRIPIPANDVDILTIGWLANEAAKRYYKKEGIKPILQLETKDGANLENDDPLGLIFTSPTQADEVNSVIVSLNLPPLPERYIEACSTCKLAVDIKIRNCLDECQATLKLKLNNFMIKKNQLTPILRSLLHQDNLQFLDFSGNPILNEGVKQLCGILPSLTQLRSLNLSLTNISADGIRSLSNLFTNNDKLVLQNLKELNLSYNVISDDSLPYLAIILQHINLHNLNLSGCNFTERLFDNISNNGIILNLDQLEALDLSYNDLNKDGVIMFLSFLNFNIVSHLNFSNNSGVNESGIGKEIAENLLQSDIINIKSLNLVRCRINDSEIWDLLRPLAKAKDFETINLSYNNDLTSISLRRLIQHRPSFSSIILEGCSNITEYLDQSLSMTPNSSELNNITLKSLKVSFDYIKYKKEADILITMWQRQWGNKSKIQKVFNKLMHFSVIE